MIDSQAIRSKFPVFSHYPHLMYFDNAATTQKPSAVIEGIHQFYEKENANIHRGIYPLAAQATRKYEDVREKVKKFLKASDQYEIVYTKGTTDSINLVANAFVKPKLNKKDNIVITAMEHHANLIPWQALCKEKKVELRIISISEKGELKLDKAKKLFDKNTQLFSCVHVSNTLGTINPIEELIHLAHKRHIPILIDGAQSAAHMELNIDQWNCDFYTFSAHKMFGPTGIGILCAKKEILEKMQPYQFGGDMIRHVSFSEVSFADIPQRFEPGTPNIAGVVGMGYAIDFLNSFHKEEIHKHVKELGAYAAEKLSGIPEVKVIGEAENRSGIVSFIIDGVHPHDIATFLGEENIAIRAGHHCTQPLMGIYGIAATARASLSIYNSKDEIDQLELTVKDVIKFFS